MNIKAPVNLLARRKPTITPKVTRVTRVTASQQKADRKDFLHIKKILEIDAQLEEDEEDILRRLKNSGNKN